jgi:ERCC4-type nuclease
VFAIDTREQRPYPLLPSVRKTLRTGDYSVLGLEDRVTIERKSQKDAYATLGQDRDRFERELERMAEMDYAAIVLECSLSDFLIPPVRSRVNPQSAIGSVVAWTVRYRIPVFFADGRTGGAALVRRLLERYVREIGDPDGR